MMVTTGENEIRVSKSSNSDKGRIYDGSTTRDECLHAMMNESMLSLRFFTPAAQKIHRLVPSSSSTLTTKSERGITMIRELRGGGERME